MSSSETEDTPGGMAPRDKAVIRDLAGLLDETGLDEIEIEQQGYRVRVSRGRALSAVSLPPAPLHPHIEVPRAAPASGAAAADGPHPGTVKSPMVGTAYRASSPTSAPFVEVGADVRQGQTLLIIEAMKTMNQIPSPRAGKVKEIFVTDGQPVEYDEPLMIIE